MPGCSAFDCSNRSEQGFQMKVFPRDAKRRSLWESKVRRLNWVPTNSCYLCEVHFEEDQFKEPGPRGKRILKKDAVPTLFSHSKISVKRKSPVIRDSLSKKKLQNDSVIETDREDKHMPKNPWVYKSRKRRRNTKKPPTVEELNPQLPTVSNIDISMGSLSSETLAVPLNQLKKEIIYPDTRFQRSTTLFPAMLDENCDIPRKTLKRDPEETEKDSGLEAEGSSKEWSNEVMSEISLPNDNLRKYEGIMNPVSKFQRSSTHFPARGIENIIPERHSEISGRATEDEKSVLGQEVYYKMPDPSISIDTISEIPLSKSNPSKYEGTVCSDALFQSSNALFPSEEVKVIPSETLYVNDDFLTVPENVDMKDFTNFDHCVSNPQDEAEEIDQTDVSHRAMSQLKMLEVRSIPAEELSETSLEYDDLNSTPQDVKMIDLRDSDYCAGSVNSRLPEIVSEMVDTNDFSNFNHCAASHILNPQEEAEEMDLKDVSHRAMSQLKMLEIEGVPAEELSETSLVYDDFETTSEEVEVNDLTNFNNCDVVINSDFPDDIEEIDLTEDSRRVMNQLKTLQVESMPFNRPTEILPANDAFGMKTEKIKMNDLPNSDYCVVVENSPNEVEEIDLTNDSPRVLSRFITLD